LCAENAENNPNTVFDDTDHDFEKKSLISALYFNFALKGDKD